MLRHASSDNADVLLHMLEIIDVISQDTKSPDDRQKLLVMQPLSGKKVRPAP